MFVYLVTYAKLISLLGIVVLIGNFLPWCMDLTQLQQNSFAYGATVQRQKSLISQYKTGQFKGRFMIA